MSYYDDSLDSVGIHGVSGVLGILGTGLLASKAINAAGADGLFFGNIEQLGVQALMAGAVTLFSLVGTWFILKFVDAVVGLRVSKEVRRPDWISASTTSGPIHKRTMTRLITRSCRRSQGAVRSAALSEPERGAAT